MNEVAAKKIAIERRKETIISELKKKGYRITPQRSHVIDIILERNCFNCKEIYYSVIQRDPSIGIATVYRMLTILEDTGILNRNSVLSFNFHSQKENKENHIFLQDAYNKVELPMANWYNELKKYLREQGMITNEELSVIIRKEEKV